MYYRCLTRAFLWKKNELRPVRRASAALLRRAAPLQQRRLRRYRGDLHGRKHLRKPSGSASEQLLRREAAVRRSWGLRCR